MATELEGLGAEGTKRAHGGVHFRGSWETAYRANLHSRVATRVLLRVAQGRYRSEADLHRLAYEQPWPDWFEPHRSIRLHTTAIRSPLRSIDYVTVHMKDAIVSRFLDVCRKRPDVNTDNPDIRIHVFLDEDTATLYLDLSGDPLFKRGYRQARNEAPIKENLAAGIILLTGWKPEEPFLDPMCGSGTFLLEAAQMALGIPAGNARQFAFEKLKSFQPALWRGIREEADRVRKEREHRDPPRIYGCDISNAELRAARQNVQEAGLADLIKLKQADILKVGAPEDHGVLVTNPPYGVRIGDEEGLLELYPQLGDALKWEFPGWRCFFLSADPQLAKRIRLSPSRKTPLFNGALECRLLEYRIQAAATPALRDDG